MMLECKDLAGFKYCGFHFFKKGNGSLGAGKRMSGMLTVCSSVSFSWISGGR